MRYATEEERRQARRDSNNRCYAKKHADGPHKTVFATEEERYAAKLQRNREYYQQKKLDEAGTAKKRRSKYANHEEKLAAQRARYAEQREARTAALRQWRAEHPGEYHEQRRREYERLKAERAKKQAAETAATEQRVNDARAELPENGPWLREWCEAHGLNEAQAKAKAQLGGATWAVLWRGGKTIPSLALVVGHNLGMTPDEVKHLGIICDRSKRALYEDDKRIETYNPEHFELDWWRRVEDYPAGKVLTSLGRRAQAIDW